MAEEPIVVLEPMESASDRDAANYRDASMRQLEMFLDKAKRLAEERISLARRARILRMCGAVASPSSLPVTLSSAPLALLCNKTECALLCCINSGEE